MKADFDFTPYYGKMCELEYFAELMNKEPCRRQGVVHRLKYYLDYPDSIIFRGRYVKKRLILGIKVVENA
jgi:hypothetical protein